MSLGIYASELMGRTIENDFIPRVIRNW